MTARRVWSSLGSCVRAGSSSISVYRGLDGWEFLARAKADPELADVPVVIVSMVDERNRGLGLGAADYLVKPVTRDDLLRALTRVTPLPAYGKVLAIDDDPMTLELLQAVLEPVGYTVLTARTGEEGVALARSEAPDLVLLDLVMPGFPTASRSSSA